MILTCPECKSRYVVNPKALLPSGRTVRCVKCSHSWFEAKPDADVEIVPPIEEAPEPIKKEEPEKSPQQDTPNNNTVAVAVATPDEDFDFPISKPKKRKRPIPKGSNLPALQNQKHGSSKMGWVSLMVFITGILGLFLIFQESITDNWPASQKLYNTIGLTGNASELAVHDIIEEEELAPIEERLVIKGLAPSNKTINNVVNLVISGQVENISDDIQNIPTLKVRLLDGRKRILREWSFTADKEISFPSEIVKFETSLPNPPQDAKDIAVIFATN